MTDGKNSGKVDTGTVLLILVLCALFFWILRGCWHAPYIFTGHGESLLWSLIPGWRGLFGFGFFINLLLAVWVGVDAGKRGMQGLLWGLLVFFTSIVGVVVYLLVRSGSMPPLNGDRPQPPPSATAGAVNCASCQGALQPGFKICPYCGEPVERKCPSCDQPIRAGWKHCPECGANLSE